MKQTILDPRVLTIQSSPFSSSILLKSKIVPFWPLLAGLSLLFTIAMQFTEPREVGAAIMPYSIVATLTGFVLMTRKVEVEVIKEEGRLKIKKTFLWKESTRTYDSNIADLRVSFVDTPKSNNLDTCWFVLTIENDEFALDVGEKPIETNLSRLREKIGLGANQSSHTTPASAPR